MGLAHKNVTADINPSGTISASISIYFTLFLIGYISFEILQRIFGATYVSRNRSERTTCPVVERNYGILGWIIPVFKTSEDDILEYCGLDSLCFLRFLRLGQKLALCGIVMSAFLFPWYATGTNPNEDIRLEIDPLERITMSNLSSNEIRIWGSVLAMYIMSFFAMYLFIQEYKVYMKRRHQFLGQLGPQQYSVVINDLPKHLRTNHALKKYMMYLFPAHVHSVNVSVECEHLEEKVAARLETRNNLEHALAEYGATGKRPTHKPSAFGEGKVDSINYFQAKLGRMNREVSSEIKAIQSEDRRVSAHGEKRDAENPDRSVSHGDDFGETGNESGGGDRDRDGDIENGEGNEQQEKALTTDNGNEQEGGESPNTSTPGNSTKLKFKMRLSAFVSFTSLKSAQSAQQLLQTDDPVEMTVGPAPHPTDIVWENIGRSKRERGSWEMVSWFITVGIVLFWTIPTAFIASLSTVESLRENIPLLDSIFNDYRWLEGFAKQLSPIGLIVMTMLASYLFGLLSRREGHASVTQVYASHFSKLVYFQIFQIFFVSVIAGTVFGSLEAIIEDPKEIINFLGTTMPAQSTMFISYIIIQIGLKLTIELLRVVPLVKALFYKIGAPTHTKRERTSPWLGLNPSSEPGQFIQTEKLPDFFLAILLVFAFCAIAPLLCYFAGLFLLLADLVYRRNVLFVYDPFVHSTGVFWPKLHNCLVGALLLGQVTFLGLVSLKVSPAPIFLATILPFFTLAYYLYMDSSWPRVSKNLPLNHCRKIDKAREGVTDFGFLDWAYVQPALAESAVLVPEYEYPEAQEEREEGGSPRYLVVSPSTTADTEAPLVEGGV